jgi:PAS domain S-box-containing protein
MSWILSSIISAIISTVVITVSYFYVYFKEREKFILIWALSWSAYSLKLLSDINLLESSHPSIISINVLLTISSALGLMYGAYVFNNKSFPVFWFASAFFAGIASITLGVIGANKDLAFSPTMYYCGFAFIWIGGIINRRQKQTTWAHKLLAASMFLWGLHKLLTPFLLSDSGIIIFTYWISTFLVVFSGLSFILLFFEVNRVKLIDSANRLKLLFENHSSIFLLIDPDNGAIEYANPSALKFYGYTQDEITKKKIDDINTLSTEKVREEMLRAQRSEKFYFDFKHRLKSGEVRDVEVHTQINNFNDKQLIFSIVNDVTEKNRTRELLQESENKFRTLVENIPGAVYRCELNEPWRAIFVSPNIYEITGYFQDEFTREDFPISFASIIHPDDLKYVSYNVEVAIERFKQYAIEYRIIKKDGGITWFFEKGRAIYDEKNMPLYLDGVFVDINERKIVERALQESENKFRNAFETLPDAMIISDLSTNKILEVNKGFCNMTGYNRSELIGVSISELNLWQKNEFFKSFNQILIREQLIQSYEAKFVKKDNSNIIVLISACMIDLSDRKTSIALIRDINDLKIYEKEIHELNSKLENKVKERTRQLNEALENFTQEMDARKAMQERLEESNYELKELNQTVIQHSHKLIILNEKLAVSEAELTELNKDLEQKVEERTHELSILNNRLEETNKLKGIILNNLGHELRTPLNGALGFTALLSMELTEPEYKEMAQLSLKAMKRLERTLNSLLFLTEIESEKHKMNFEYSNLDMLVKLYFNTIAEVFEKDNLKFSVEILKENSYALIDEQLFYQTLYNLLDNSVKFTESGFIKMQVDSEYLEDKEWAVVRIIDSGIGIKEENIDRIFEPFRQESEGIARVSEGLGLGLSISKKMIELMGGKLTMKSKFGEGTCASIYLINTELMDN